MSAGEAKQVRNEDRPCSWSDGLANLLIIDREVGKIDIHKHRCQPELHHRRDGCGPGDSGHDDLVPGAPPGRLPFAALTRMRFAELPELT